MISVFPISMTIHVLVSTSIAAGLVLSDLRDAAADLTTVAPIAIKRDWLGHVMDPDFGGPTTRRVIEAPIISTSVDRYGSDASELATSAAVAAAIAGHGVKVPVAASKRYALLRVHKVVRVDELDLRRAKVVSTIDGFVPIRIHYGWALYVLVESDASAVSAEASARILGVDANVVAQAQIWGATTRVSVRGLRTRMAGEVVIPRDVTDIATRFSVGDEPPQPILVDYHVMGAPASTPLARANFTEPAFEDFDGPYAKYRLYRDPRVAPGTTRVRMTNLHPHDAAVWEIWRRGAAGHAYRWEQGGGQTLERAVATPTWPMQLVWVGHRTRLPNPTLDGESGWTLDLVRTR